MPASASDDITIHLSSDFQDYRLRKENGNNDNQKKKDSCWDVSQSYKVAVSTLDSSTYHK